MKQREGNIYELFYLIFTTLVEEGITAVLQMRHLKLRRTHLPGVSFCSS